MKTQYIFIVFFTCFSFLINAQGNEVMKGKFIKDSSNWFILNLPYEVEDNVEYVFDGDTPMAIDIIEIRADGKKLFFIEDIGVPEGGIGFNIQKTIKDKNIYFISMFWRSLFSGKVLRWNDGRGIIFTEIQRNTFKPSTNTYEISRNTKKLEIIYRILLPYPSLSRDDLYNKTYINNFSKENTIIVDMSML